MNWRQNTEKSWGGRKGIWGIVSSSGRTLPTAPWPQNSVLVLQTDQKHPQFSGIPMDKKSYKIVYSTLNGRSSVSWEQLNHVLWVPFQFCLNISAPLSLLSVSILTNKLVFFPPQSFNSIQNPPTDLHSHPTQMLAPLVLRSPWFSVRMWQSLVIKILFLKYYAKIQVVDAAFQHWMLWMV